MTTPARLTLLRTSPASVLTDYQQLLGSLGMAQSALQQPWTVAPALERRYPFPGASTPPWQLEGALLALRACGARNIRLRLPQVGDHHEHAFCAICDRYGVPIAGTGESTASAGSSALLLLPTLRRGPCQPLGGAGWLALRLQAGLMASQFPTATNIVRALETLQSRYQPVVALMDAAMVGNGAPGRADCPEVGNLLLGATDLVALDTLAAQLLGISVAPGGELTYLTEAQRHGLGTMQIDTGAYAGELGLQQRWPARLARRRLSRDRAASFNDWSAQDREIYTSWLYDTAWGKLFASYYSAGKSNQL